MNLLQIITRLMAADNFGDVHEVINDLHDLVGLPRPKGSFLTGWEKEDWKNLRHPRGNL